MNLTELWSLTQWIDREIPGKDVIRAYETLRRVLESNAGGGAQQPFEEQRDRLLETVRSVDLNSLSREQLEFLDRMEIGPYVGPKAGTRIEDVLYRNVLDLQTAATKMGEAKDAITRGLGRSNQLKEGLEGLLQVGDDFPVSQVLVRVTFEHRASIANVVDLKVWSNVWHDIARGLAMLHDRPPEEVSVVGAGSGSVVFDFSVDAVVMAMTLTTILLRGLKVTERVYDIRMKAEELRGMKLKNKKLVHDLERAADGEKEQAATVIADEVLKENHIDRDDDGEKATAFQMSVNKLLDFLDKGGNVDVVVPPDEPAEETAEDEAPDEFRRTAERLRVLVQEVHQIETRIRELEAGPNDQSG